MKKILKRMISIFVVLTLSFTSFAAIVSDNDGSAFITKAEFDSLRNDFQSQIDSYNTSIDSKIDGAIAAYLAGISVYNYITLKNIYNNYKSSYHYKQKPRTTLQKYNGHINANNKFILKNHDLYLFDEKCWEPATPSFSNSLSTYGQHVNKRNSVFQGVTNKTAMGVDSNAKEGYILSGCVDWEYQNVYSSTTRQNYGTSSMLITYSRYLLTKINDITAYYQVPHFAILATGFWSGQSPISSLNWPGGVWYPTLWCGHSNTTVDDKVYSNWEWTRKEHVLWRYDSSSKVEIEQGAFSLSQIELSDESPWLIPTYDAKNENMIALPDNDQVYSNKKPTLVMGQTSRSGYQAPSTNTQYGSNGLDILWFQHLGYSSSYSTYNTVTKRCNYLLDNGYLDYINIKHSGLSFAAHANWDKYLRTSNYETAVDTKSFVDADLLKNDGIEHNAAYGLVLAKNDQKNGEVTVKVKPSNACTIRVWASDDGTKSFSSIDNKKKKEIAANSTLTTIKIDTKKNDYIWVSVGGLSDGVRCSLDVDSIVLKVD